MSYFITPRVTPLYYHYSNEPSICDAFDNSRVQYISDTLHMIISVFNPKFIHYTKYVKYAFLLLFSIYVSGSFCQLKLSLVQVCCICFKNAFVVIKWFKILSLLKYLPVHHFNRNTFYRGRLYFRFYIRITW